MTTISKNVLTYFIISAFAFSSCKKSATTIISDGTWYVSLFTEDNDDETSDFSGYIFDFKKEGTLLVTFSGGTASGTWSYDDSGSKYRIIVSGNKQLDEISDDWLIVSKSSSLIELKDDNSARNEVLNFSKK